MLVKYFKFNGYGSIPQTEFLAEVEVEESFFMRRDDIVEIENTPYFVSEVTKIRSIDGRIIKIDIYVVAQ